MFYLVSPESIVNHIYEARDKKPVCLVKTHLVCKSSIRKCHHGISAKGHHEDRRAKVGPFTEILDGKRPDTCIYE
jgi:hypothetical protein